MAPPKKPSGKRESSNTYKKFDPNEQYYKVENEQMSKAANRIGQNSIQKQLNNAPQPSDTGKSGYPHHFENIGNIPQLLKSTSRVSSTTSLYGYPVFADGHNYDYQSRRPKEPPGHIRSITNQNKRPKGVVAHPGEEGNPNGGHLKWVKKEGEAESEPEPEPEPEPLVQMTS
ncbi:hypothetical protein Daus18300_014011 [Diaporthe australafricana]|uniref:Uncharacterized protein n=1 Tax=Diaporthe australafricana TaxID=127596 RepID=A0ABR3VWX5_9PEZI